MLYRKAELDVDAVTELVMWIENDYRLYQMQEHYNKNMARKTANGTYDRNLAVKQYMPLAEAGAKSYVKEFGGVWHQIFPMDVRRAAAEYFRDYFENEVAVNPARFEKHVFKKDVKKWRERYPQRGAAVYPKDVAEEVSLSRPDLAAGDAIATVLTWDPTLTADEVIEILDQSAADYRDEVEYERRPQRGAAVRRAFRDDALHQNPFPIARSTATHRSVITPLQTAATEEFTMIRRNNRPQRRRLADRVATARRNSIRKDRFAQQDDRLDGLRRRIASLKAQLRRAEQEEERPVARRPLRERVAAPRPLRDRPVGRRPLRERAAEQRPVARRPLDRVARRSDLRDLDQRREERLAALRERLEVERRREQRLAAMRRRAAVRRRPAAQQDERPERPVARRRPVAKRAATKRNAAPKYIRHKCDGKLYVRVD